MNEPDKHAASSISALHGQLQTYHCLCSTLILTTSHNLDELSSRAEPVQDGALILPLGAHLSTSDFVDTDGHTGVDSVMSNVVPDRKAVIIRREDGFEKRIMFRCSRCKLVLGYQLDESHFETSQPVSRPIYLLPGGLIGTEKMIKGERPEMPPWAGQTV
ncbi:hypothetical protein PV10_06958 [Exophiala mesophila]|uniref:STEEP1 domain-containing protein n=1 Tax=Exophiala mesophila TaxID=212818 RepID=A0A0D1ZS32_EXOME|nr:uncharacterized protein PV10_06958 [Exophiala mesophila]KIV89568.1 hypothetical protein PV10_06958 [Exophiala mesophila]